MKKQILRISPLQTAKMLAALYFVFTIPFVLLMFAIMMLTPGPKPPFYFGGFMLIAPFFYAIFGFLFTLLGAWIYNLLAAKIGGVEFTVREVPDA
jgi:hypothetical protein